MYEYLVLGASGKTGREVVRGLIERGAQSVNGATRSRDTVLPSGARPVLFDWSDRTTWNNALAGVAAVHLVKPRTAAPATTVLEFLSLSSALKRVVLLSEIDAETRHPATPERQVELAVQSLPLDWTILRLNWFMQNFTSPGFYLSDIRDRGRLALPTGGAATSFIDTRDIGDVAATCLMGPEHAQQAISLTGPDALTWSEAARHMSSAAGHPVEYVDVPLAEASAKSRADGASDESVAYSGRYYGAIIEGRTAIVTPDVERLLGRPARTFSAFTRENASAWQRQVS